MMKRSIAGNAILMLTALLSGCSARAVNRTDGIRIGVSVYDSHDVFLSQLMDEFNTLADSNVTIVTYNAAQSQNSQDEQAQEMIESGCDVMCINLVDRTEPAAIINLAVKNNVPVIFFNRELVPEDLEQWDGLYYVGADAIQSGTLQGELAAADIRKNESAFDTDGDGQIQYVLLEGEAGHQDAVVRSEYSVQTMIDEGIHVDRVGYGIANWNRSQAQSKVSQMIGQNQHIELILANNDEMALGAIDAYRKTYGNAVQEYLPAIYGIDGTADGLSAVRDGTLKGTVYNDKEGQAEAMYSLACSLARGEDLQQYQLTDGKYRILPYAMITPDNYNEYIAGK